MGNDNSVTIDVEVENSGTIDVERENSVYFDDETVSGTVNLNVTEEVIEMNEMYVTLFGQKSYSYPRTRWDSKGNSYIEYDTCLVTFYSKKISLVTPEHSQTRATLKQGEYSWPFEFPLDEHLPPTMNTPASTPHVAYYLQIVIDRPWYKSNTKKTKSITIHPRLNVSNSIEYLTPTIFDKTNGKEIRLRGTLNKSGYLPGECIHISFIIENPEKRLIKGIDLSIEQATVVERSPSTSYLYTTTLPNIINTKDDLIEETLSIMIPPGLLPPSYAYHLENQLYGTIIVSYVIKLEFRLKGLFSNFEVHIPFTIGTD